VTIKTALAARGWEVGPPLPPLQAPPTAEAAWIAGQVEKAEYDAGSILDE
jgi:hypothetical protein